MKLFWIQESAEEGLHVVAESYPKALLKWEALKMAEAIEDGLALKGFTLDAPDRISLLANEVLI